MNDATTRVRLPPAVSETVEVFLEADYSADFVVTRVAIEEDLAACGAFVPRVRTAIASVLP